VTFIWLFVLDVVQGNMSVDIEVFPPWNILWPDNAFAL